MRKISLSVLFVGIFLGSLSAQIYNPPARLGAQNSALNVSVSLDGKFTPAALIDWLRKQDFSFVLKSSENFGKEPIEIRIKNKPLRDVLEAIAFALDSQWLEKGEIYILSGPQVFVSNGAVITSSGRIISGPVPPGSRTEPASTTIPSTPQPQLKLFVYSLTTAQQNLLKKNGFLTLNDLSKHQLSLLANPKADGSMIDTIVDGQRVAVKLTRQSG